jgi:hypothetical protein
MGLSSDEKVLKEMGGDIKKAYSASLLSLASGKRIINGSPLAFGEGNVKGRIKNSARVNMGISTPPKAAENIGGFME